MTPSTTLQANGSSYERSAIEKWLEDHDTDPETGVALESKMLFPNRRLRTLIREFQAMHGHQHANYNHL